MFDFDREVAVEKLKDGHYRGFISSAWNIGTNPNGGYLVSIAIEAIKNSVTHPHPMSITTHYLRPGTANAACEVLVDIVRTGKTLSTVRASLIQEDKARLEVLAVFADLSESVGVDHLLTMAAPELPDPASCVTRDGNLQGLDLPIAGRLDTRLEPGCAFPGKSNRALLLGWNRFQDGRQPDACSLPLFCDTFPPSPFAQLGSVGWVPTIELTVHVRKPPAAGWLKARFESSDLVNGRMIENGYLWDSNDELVAQSRQVGLVMKASE